MCVLTEMSLLTVFARGVPYLIITVTYYGFGMAPPRYINKRVVTRQSALKDFLKTKKPTTNVQRIFHLSQKHC